jgi:hypothetical protein
MIAAKELETKSPEELAILAERNHPLSAQGVLIRDERQRRARIKQHELDIKLMSKQVRSMIFAAIFGVLATLAGAVLGPYLQHIWSRQPPQKTQPIIQQEIGASLGADHRTKPVSLHPAR